MAINLRSRRLANPLLRRVQRHAALTTLFRSLEDQDLVKLPVQARRLTRLEEGPSPRVPLVSAGLVPVNPVVPVQVEESRLPLPYTPVPMPPQRPQSEPGQPTQSLPVQAPQTPIQRTPAPPTKAVESRQPVVQRQPEQPVVAPETAPADGEDRIWSRLQNIFRRHEQKRQAEEIAEQPAGSSETESSPAPHIQRAEEASVSPPPPPVLESKHPEPVLEGDDDPRQDQEEAAAQQAQPQREQPAQPAPVEPPLESPVMRKEDLSGLVRTAPEPLTTPGEEITPQQPARSVKLPPEDRPELAAPPERSPATVQESPQENAERDKPVDELPAAVVQQHPAENDGTRPPADELPAVQLSEEIGQPPVSQVPERPVQTQPDLSPVQRSEPEPTRQDRITVPDDPDVTMAAPAASAPLESVWPVQRLSRDAPAQLQQEGSGSDTLFTPPSAEMAASVEARQVSGLLDSVAPRQPTESSVEVVTPRRPRPVVPDQPVDVRVEAPAGQVEQVPEVAAQRTALQSLDEPGLQPPDIQASPLDQPSGRPTVTPQPEQPPDESQEPPPQPLVSTDIGELPVDLWHLIGAEPPPVQRQPAQVEAPAERVQPVQFVTQAAPRYLSPQDESPPDIQMAVQEGRSMSFQAEREQEEERPGEAELDVDELTRKVYKEIKRRLSSEWERMRRRF